MNCGILTNRKWNYGHVSVLPIIFVICSLTLVEVGHAFFINNFLFYFILFYFILFYFIFSFLVVFLQYNFTISLVVFHLYNVLRHTHKQEMELRTCVCTSSYFCHLFTDPCWGRTCIFLNKFYFILFYFCAVSSTAMSTQYFALT